MYPQPWGKDGEVRGTGAQLELPLVGSISKSTVGLLGHGHLAEVGERGGCPVLLPRAALNPSSSLLQQESQGWFCWRMDQTQILPQEVRMVFPCIS